MIKPQYLIVGGINGAEKVHFMTLTKSWKLSARLSETNK